MDNVWLFYSIDRTSNIFRKYCAIEFKLKNKVLVAFGHVVLISTKVAPNEIIAFVANAIISHNWLKQYKTCWNICKKITNDNEDLHWKKKSYDIIQKAIYTVDTTLSVLSI